jgi:hypothetical protein
MIILHANVARLGLGSHSTLRGEALHRLPRKLTVITHPLRRDKARVDLIPFRYTAF